MTIRHILLPVASDNADVTHYALDLALRSAAHLTAGFRETRDFYMQAVGPGLDYSGYARIIDVMSQRREKMKAAARKTFEAAALTLGVDINPAPVCGSGSAHWMESRESDPLSAFGALADVIISELPSNAELPQPRAIVEAGLFAMRRPMLLVPPGCRKADFHRPVIAWDGSRSCANAALCAADLMPSNTTFAVLQAGAPPKRWCPAENLLSTLIRRGFAADLEQIPDHPFQTAERLLSEAGTLGASVLVMGASSHGRARTFFLGGVTDYMLRNAGIPLLLCH